MDLSVVRNSMLMNLEVLPGEPTCSTVGISPLTQRKSAFSKLAFFPKISGQEAGSVKITFE